MFRFDDPTIHAEQLISHFQGQEVTYEQVRDYALNESPFPNPKGMLKALETANRITITSARGRRKGTFPEDAQTEMSIRFHN